MWEDPIVAEVHRIRKNSRRDSTSTFMPVSTCASGKQALGSRLVSLVKPPANQRLKLTGAAILVFRASTSLQAAPAA